MRVRRWLGALLVADVGCADDGAQAGDQSELSTSDMPDTGSSPADTSNSSAIEASSDGSTGDAPAGCAALQAHAEALAAAGFSGALGVVRGDEALLWSAYGSCIRESSTPCDVTTVFDIGSITKQATAAAIMALQEDGELGVDDTLELHLPSVPADKAGITLHQLLTHTAGFPDAIGDDYDPVDREAWLAQAFATELVSAPGSEHRYSNVGYSILASIVEIRSGTSYEQYLATRLFVPSALRHTGYVLPDFGDVTVAHGYLGDETIGAPNDLPWDTTGPWWNLRGNGGLLSDLADMRAWHEALLADAVLSPASKEAMYTPWVDEGFGDSFYGYGWVIIEVPQAGTLITHNGGNLYFFADYLRFVDAGLVVIVLDNAYDFSHDDIGADLAQIALTECG